MKYSLLSIFSIFISFAGLAQVDSVMINTADTAVIAEEVAAVDDDVLEAIRIFQPQIYIDYGKLATTAIGLENKLEGGVSLLFYEKFEANVEFGQATLSPEHAYKNGNYESIGQYYRLGGGIILPVNLKSSIGLGVRYGVSRFEDQGLIEIRSSSGLQDGLNLPFSRNDLTARWWSAVLTSESRVVFKKAEPEAKINHLIKLGFFFRMRFLVTYDNVVDPVEVYSIPGYGSAVNRQQAAFNLYLKFTP